MRMPVGFVGLGQMGQPMARNLVSAGIPVRAYDVHPERTAAAAAFGAKPVASVADTVTPGGIVITMIPDDAALEEVALGSEGVLASIGPGGIHLSMSTVSTRVSSELEERYAAAESTYLAATVLGRPDVAAAGELTIFIAGEPHAKGRVSPLLNILGRRSDDLGDRAALANVAKVAANFLIMSTIEALAEAAALVERHGIDRREFVGALLGSPLFGGAVFEGYGSMIAEHRYQPALFPVRHGLKDAGLVLDTAAEVDAATPIAAVVRRHLVAARELGWEDHDWAVIGLVVSNGRP